MYNMKHDRSYEHLKEGKILLYDKDLEILAKV